MVTAFCMDRCPYSSQWIWFILNYQVPYRFLNKVKPFSFTASALWPWQESLYKKTSTFLSFLRCPLLGTLHYYTSCNPSLAVLTPRWLVPPVLFNVFMRTFRLSLRTSSPGEGGGGRWGRISGGTGGRRGGGELGESTVRGALWRHHQWLCFHQRRQDGPTLHWERLWM